MPISLSVLAEALLKRPDPQISTLFQTPVSSKKVLLLLLLLLSVSVSVSVLVLVLVLLLVLVLVSEYY